MSLALAARAVHDFRSRRRWEIGCRVRGSTGLMVHRVGGAGSAFQVFDAAAEGVNRAEDGGALPHVCGGRYMARHQDADDLPFAHRPFHAFALLFSIIDRNSPSRESPTVNNLGQFQI